MFKNGYCNEIMIKNINQMSHWNIILKNKMKIIKLPPYSTDLNPILHVWKIKTYYE